MHFGSQLHHRIDRDDPDPKDEMDETEIGWARDLHEPGIIDGIEDTQLMTQPTLFPQLKTVETRSDSSKNEPSTSGYVKRQVRLLEDEVLERRRAYQREYQRKKRALETDQDTQERLQKNADQKRKKREEMSNEDKERRRSDEIERQRNTRSRMSEEQKDEYNRQQAERRQISLLLESDSDTDQRRDKEAVKKRRTRSSMTDEMKVSLRIQGADRRREIRLDETEEEQADRQARDAESKRKHRQNETEKERRTRLQITAQKRKDKEANANVRARVSVDTLHYMGPMSEECEHCKALFFKSEVLGKKMNTINFCCSSGTIQLEEHFSNFPPQLQELFQGSNDPAEKDRNEQSKNFRAQIRQFNNSLATASFGPQTDRNVNKGHGPFTVKVHGQVYHRAGPLHPKPGQRRKYGQLFFLDSAQAARERMDIPENAQCDQSIMEELSELMMRINVFSQSYKLMREVEEQEELEAQLAGRTTKQVKMMFDVSKPNLDLRRYNLPKSNEVAVVYVQEDGMVPSRSVSAYSRDQDGWLTIYDTDPIVDPMTYPLFFPNGERGWSPGLTRIGSSRKSTRIAQQPYYRYMAMIRRNRFNPIHYGATLTQQFFVDCWAKTEQNRLKFHRDNQAKIRAEEYQELKDYVSRGPGEFTPGKRVILPSSFHGSPRHMVQEYQDCMAIVTRTGKPDLFVTFTCNPKWKEIQENLNPGQTASDRPDLIARVFSEKVDHLMDVILKKNLLGKVTAHIRVFEWQKRGLPHLHMLLTMKDGDKPKSKDDIDRLIRAEIPDPVQEPRLHDIVTRQMIHRPCGLNNLNSPCTDKDGNCLKRFPKPFRNDTKWEQNGYPEYRRRNDGRSIKSGGCDMTNQHVVPYNPDLLLMFDAHINVEACALIEVVKYLVKYVYKGQDRASIAIQSVEDVGKDRDEIKEYLDCRYICAPEACHHLFGFSCHVKSHVICRLPIHLPNRQSVTFVPGKEKEAVATSERKGSKLMEYFRINADFDEMEANGEDITGKEDPRKCSYMDFPTKFVWSDELGKWKERRRGGDKVIGRIYAVTPSDPERFALRLLLLATSGASSFEDLRTVPDDNGDPIVHPTFVMAARALGLLKDDAELQKAMEECGSFQMPKQMRATFASILLFNEVGDPQFLWDKFKDSMSEDFVFRGCGEEEAEARAYEDVREKMSRLGKDIQSFIAPPIHVLTAPLIDHIDFDDIRKEGDRLIDTLNPQQMDAFRRIIEAVDDPRLQRLFFLDGPGGSGKTYLYNVIFKVLLGKDIKIACCAWTGIASTLLPDGRTIASFFKMDIKNDCRASLLKLNSKEAALLRKIKVFIVDEASMIAKNALETMDKVLRDVMENDIPFGGKVIILGGDFRQVLPVIRRGTRKDQVDGCIKMSCLWDHFETLHLKSNMRVAGGDLDWIEFLLKVGDGSANDEADRIKLEEDLYTTGDLIEEVFGQTINKFTDLSESAILTPKNVNVDKMNEDVHNKMEGAEKVFYSRDEVPDDSNRKVITTEYLNSINTSSLPPHKLKLKVGSIVMLLRNLDVSTGLCNGTRLKIMELGRRILKCQFVVGSRVGQTVLIPRIDCYDDNNLAFKLRRTQFPVRLAFALSINKAQGQSFGRIGLWLPEDVFTHGQMYVALSRVRSKEGLFVKAVDSDQLNVLYKEIL
ncbi:unnamed protein product [Caenorhabditis nigoni]